MKKELIESAGGSGWIEVVFVIRNPGKVRLPDGSYFSLYVAYRMASSAKVDASFIVLQLPGIRNLCSLDLTCTCCMFMFACAVLVMHDICVSAVFPCHRQI